MQYLTIEEAKANIGYPLRDPGLLESAINRARWDLEEDDAFSKAARIMAGIIKNHPCIDGNKRSSLELSDAFLRKNNLRLGNTNKDRASIEEALYELVLGIASKRYDEDHTTKVIREIASHYDGNGTFAFKDEYPILIEKLSRT